MNFKSLITSQVCNGGSASHILPQFPFKAQWVDPALFTATHQAFLPAYGDSKKKKIQYE